MKRRLLREPLVHFMLLGALLFGAYAYAERNRGGVEQSKHIRLTIDGPRGCKYSGSFFMAMRRTVVAVVDDNLAIRKAMATLLSALGYCAELFASGEEFLDVAARSKASCLIVDIQLGDISGVELGRQLATTGFTFPIIFMTASDDETIRSGATQLGCVAYLRKPFHADELIDAIVKAVGPVA
jgi:CheY-like chemotaxis protein